MSDYMLNSNEISVIETFDSDKPMSEAAQKIFNEMKAAMVKDGQSFTRLAYKTGESAIRRFLASNDFLSWESYLEALNGLGTAGKAVRSLAIAVARFVCGGRTVKDEKEGSYYFSPSRSFLECAVFDGVAIWGFSPLANDEAHNEALDFARANKGKLFTLNLQREPARKGVLDAFLDNAVKLETRRSNLNSEDKAEKAKAKKIEAALVDLANVSGVPAEHLRAALDLLATARVKALAAKKKSAK